MAKMMCVHFSERFCSFHYATTLQPGVSGGCSLMVRHGAERSVLALLVNLEQAPSLRFGVGFDSRQLHHTRHFLAYPHIHHLQLNPFPPVPHIPLQLKDHIEGLLVLVNRGLQGFEVVAETEGDGGEGSL